MTIDTGSRGLRLVTGTDTTGLVDARCGECAACGVGRDYWCLDARESGPVLAEIAGVRDHALVRRWISALAALAAARHEPTAALLVLAHGSPELVTELVSGLHAGAVVVAPDARDPEMRRRLSELSSTGRAPLVLTVTDVRTAVRAVERGGQVCGPDDAMLLPSVTELVQRDVTLVSAQGIDALVTGSSWSVLAERLSTLLDAPIATGANL
jgi:hypothetical protein